MKSVEFYLRQEKISGELMHTFRALYEKPIELKKELYASEDRHQYDRAEIENKLREEKLAFIRRTLELPREIEQFEHLIETSDRAYVQDSVVKLEAFDARLKSMALELEDIKERESKLGILESSVDKFRDIQNEFTPHLLFWRSLLAISNLKHTLSKDPISSLEYAEIKSILESNKTLVRERLISAFKTKNVSYQQKSVVELDAEIEMIARELPLIQQLTNKALRGRHWQKISELIQGERKEGYGKIVGKEIFFKGISYDFGEIVSQAEREVILENSMEGMRRVWESTELRVVDRRKYQVLDKEAAN